MIFDYNTGVRQPHKIDGRRGVGAPGDLADSVGGANDMNILLPVDSSVNPATKCCTSCSTIKPIQKFYRKKTSPDGHCTQCKTCARAWQRAYNKHIRVRVKRRRQKLKERYGISEIEYNEMLSAQKHVCAICQQPEEAKANNGESIRRLAVDHCHDTGKVRGLLCGKCNRLLGEFQDDPELLLRAANYLRGNS